MSIMYALVEESKASKSMLFVFFLIALSPRAACEGSRTDRRYYASHVDEDIESVKSPDLRSIWASGAL